MSIECGRGPLISIEGLNGVGKTYLTSLLPTDLAHHEPLILEEFSARHGSDTDLGRAIVRSLYRAADGDPFLRSGHPGAETLALLAVKMFDFERCRSALSDGRLVLEGRSVHSTAVYQSLILHDDDTAAYHQAHALLALAQTWRPLPDLTILVDDDVDAALGRAERRDHRSYTPEQRHIHERAAHLYRRLAADDPIRMPVLDRRGLPTDELINVMSRLITGAIRECLTEPWRAATACAGPCRLAPIGAGAGSCPGQALDRVANTST